MEEKHRTIEEQKEKYQRRVEFMKNTLKINNQNMQKRNKQIMQHQEHINNILAQMEISKNKKKYKKKKVKMIYI